MKTLEQILPENTLENARASGNGGPGRETRAVALPQRNFEVSGPPQPGLRALREMRRGMRVRCPRAEPRVQVFWGAAASFFHRPGLRKTAHYCVNLCPNGALQTGKIRCSRCSAITVCRRPDSGDLEDGRDRGCASGGLRLRLRVRQFRGGFDRPRFKFPKQPPVKLAADEIDTSIC